MFSIFQIYFIIMLSVLCYFSPNCQFHIFHRPNLLFWQFLEESNFLFACWFPIVIGLEGALQMSLYINIESLRLKLWIRRVVNSRNSFGTWKMMQISSKLVEFCPGCLLLEFNFLKRSFVSKFFKLFSDLLVFRFNVIKIRFSSIEIVLVLSRIVTSIVFLYYLGLFCKELPLFILVFILFSFIKLATANKASPYSLNSKWCILLILELPFNLEHSPVFLNDYSCRVFFLSIFLNFIKHYEICVDHISMPCFSFFQVYCHI